MALVGVEDTEGVGRGRGDAGVRAAAAAAEAASEASRWRLRASCGREEANVDGDGLGVQDLQGVTVEAEQESHLVPGGVLGVGRGVRGEAVDEGLGVVRVVEAVWRGGR